MSNTMWRETIPECLESDGPYEAADLDEAVHLARIQLDLIEEGQDGTDHYTKNDIRAIKQWIARNSKTNTKGK